MIHPFKELRSEYASDLAHAVVTPSRAASIDSAAKKILRPGNMDVYLAACEGTTIPPSFIGALELRESDCDPTRALGQGDRWDRVSVNVPRGKGPFASRLAAMKFYIHYDRLDENSSPWSWEYACWKGEIWNGLGPRAHGRRTGYLWSGTNLYDRPSGKGGKYVADGVWSSTTYDIQLGIVPVMRRIAELDGRFAIGSALPLVEAPPLAPTPLPSPAGVGGGPRDTLWVQKSLNIVMKLRPPLDEDNDYGRLTRGAVRAYQKARGLKQDGLAGTDETIPSLESDLKKLGVIA